MFRATHQLSYIMAPAIFIALIICGITPAEAAGADSPVNIFKYGLSVDLSNTWAGYLCIAIFVAAYSLVILEENIHDLKNNLTLFLGVEKIEKKR